MKKCRQAGARLLRTGRIDRFATVADVVDHFPKGGPASMRFTDHPACLSGRFVLTASFCISAASKINARPSLNFLRLAVALITACALSSRATYSKVSEKRPRYFLSTRPVGMLANAAAAIVKAMRIDHRDPLIALW